jgi:plasmid replication initiation protein|nr:MAG TPA: hypothetical protein [Caudoviricetes sp.]
MKIEIKEKYQIVKPEEGYLLTNYKDELDIKQYSSFKECICPLSCDLKHLREITLDKDIEYKEAAKKALEEYEESIKVR